MKAKMESEFSRPVGLDELDNGEVRRTIEANEEERAALASRFDLMAIETLRANVRMRRVPGGPLVRVDGRLTADVVQRCVVTLAPLPVHVDQDFAETFGPAGYRAPEGEPDADMPEVLDDSSIDLGELVAQILLLSLDPYPRARDADSARPPRAGDDRGDRGRPFAALGEMIEKRRK